LPPQIHDFVKFFAVKREVYAREVDAIFRDFGDDRLLDEMYSKDDITGLLTDLQALIKARVSKDLGTTADMAALVLEQVMATAEESGVALAVDLARTEDLAALDRVRAEASGGGASGHADRRPGARLASIRDEHSKVMAERSSALEEVGTLRAAAEVASRTLAALTKANEALEGRLADAQEVEREARAGAGVAASRSVATAAAENAAALAATRAELAAAVAERDARLADSKQFVQLRALMNKKNAQLKELKVRLAKYEPPVEGEGEDG
jgi:leucine zipper transcription factor-like protein 1